MAFICRLVVLSALDSALSGVIHGSVQSQAGAWRSVTAGAGTRPPPAVGELSTLSDAVRLVYLVFRLPFTPFEGSGLSRPVPCVA